METSDNSDSSQQALRLAQLEIKLLREQLAKATDAAQNAVPKPPAILPIATAPKSANVLPNESVFARAAVAGKRHVLCVEDNKANIQLIETILNDRPGTDLVWADSGKKGLEMASAREPHLVLLDLDLPDMHGSEVLGRLRAQPATAETPVIVISADATPSQIERMLAAGARDYITKPFEIRRFLLMFDEVFSTS